MIWCFRWVIDLPRVGGVRAQTGKVTIFGLNMIENHRESTENERKSIKMIGNDRKSPTISENSRKSVENDRKWLKIGRKRPRMIKNDRK